MKKMVKKARIFSVILCMALIFTLCPLASHTGAETAYAAGNESQDSGYHVVKTVTLAVGETKDIYIYAPNSGPYTNIAFSSTFMSAGFDGESPGHVSHTGTQYSSSVNNRLGKVTVKGIDPGTIDATWYLEIYADDTRTGKPVQTIKLETTIKVVKTVDFSSDTVWTVGPRLDYVRGGASYASEYLISFMDKDGYYLTDPKITNLKSSNPKVAKVKETYGFIQIISGKKTGSTVISCEVNGVSLKHTFRVKYACPMKTFKVGGKSYLGSFKKKNSRHVDKNIHNKKAVIKTKGNWVITSVENVKKGKTHKKTFAKGVKSYSTKVNMVRPSDWLLVTFKNTKTNALEEILFERTYKNTGYSPAG